MSVMEYTTGMRLRFIRDVLVREKTMRIRVLHGANRTAKLHEIDEAIEHLDALSKELEARDQHNGE